MSRAAAAAAAAVAVTAAARRQLPAHAQPTSRCRSSRQFKCTQRPLRPSFITPLILTVHQGWCARTQCTATGSPNKSAPRTRQQPPRYDTASQRSSAPSAFSFSCSTTPSSPQQPACEQELWYADGYLDTGTLDSKHHAREQGRHSRVPVPHQRLPSHVHTHRSSLDISILS